MSVSNYKPSSNRIERIKAIRLVTGMGLKEAKDLSDLVDSGKSIILTVDPKKRNEALSELRNSGFNV